MAGASCCPAPRDPRDPVRRACNAPRPPASYHRRAGTQGPADRLESRLMHRYVEPLLFGLATLAVQAVGTVLLDWSQVALGVSGGGPKWIAIAALGLLAGWRWSRLDLLAIVVVNTGFYSVLWASLEMPGEVTTFLVPTVLWYFVIAGGAFVAGRWLGPRPAHA